MIRWIRRLVRRADPEDFEPEYEQHDRNIAFIEDTLVRVRAWRGVLAGDTGPTGNPVTDRVRGIYPPRDDKGPRQ